MVNNIFVFLLFAVMMNEIRAARQIGRWQPTTDVDRSDLEEETASGGRGGIAGKRSCQYIRGRIRCGYPHDEKTVVVRFVDSIRGAQDEGYSSLHGFFQVTGCVAQSSKPELHILHTCKDNQPRRLKIFMPENMGDMHNITDIIDLKSHFTNEEEYNEKIQQPCDPF
uniref:Uncharacterized protein n=1 Tax=Romanomermis culicivorax TaxID=13658 RepID=A0A915JVJ2_ROMCU